MVSYYYKGESTQELFYFLTQVTAQEPQYKLFSRKAGQETELFWIRFVSACCEALIRDGNGLNSSLKLWQALLKNP